MFDELPQPVNQNDYHCGRTFKIDEVKELINPVPSHGLIVISRGEGAVGITTANGVKILGHYKSNVQGKSKAGGQSAQRFARVREVQKNNFFKKIAKIANTAFIQSGQLKPESIVIGGTDITVSEFVDNNFLDYRLTKNIGGIYSVHHTDEQGLNKLYQIAQSEIVTNEQQKAADSIDKFFVQLNTDIETIVYGINDVKQVSQWGAIKKLLVVDKDAIPEQIIDNVTKCGGEVITIPESTPKYDEFVSGFDGIGAICRYPVK